MRTIFARFSRIAILAVPVLTLLTACAGDDDLNDITFERPETAVSYVVSITGLPEEQMREKAEQSLRVYRQIEEGAQSRAFLKRRAQDDIPTLKKLLRSRGYYSGDVSVRVDGEDDAVFVAFAVESGDPFTLARHVFVETGDQKSPNLKETGAPIGGQADATAIVTAEKAAVLRLRNNGFPYARSAKRRAVADLEAATLEIETPLDRGPAAVFGPMTFNGLDRVRARYLRTYLPWSEGDVFDLSLLQTFQRALLGTDLFATISVKPPDRPPEATGSPIQLPVLVNAEERPFRTVSAGARFSTDLGPSVRTGFEHRNLFGENETLSVEAQLGVQVQRVGIGYREPQYLHAGQDLTAGVIVEREEDDAFDQLTTTATLGIERRLSSRLVVGAGGLVEISQISDNGQDQRALLAGLPLFASYDSSDDALDPSRGQRLRLDLTPFAGTFDGEFAGFLTADANGSVYYDVLGNRNWILAGRGRLATILTDELPSVPQTRRLYSGGGGSVRGFAQRFVGPLDSFNDPVGGLSAAELGAEARARVYGDFGATAFVEAGSVSEQSLPDFNEGVQFAAGLGLRYFSPAGPIRIDLALPLNPRDADDAFQLYFSIGQAF